jgi:hypothetical protein
VRPASRWLILLGLCIAACKGPAKFDKQHAEQRCAMYEECEVLDMYGYSSPAECDADLRNTYDDCKDYNRKAAKQCIEELEAMSCGAVFDERFPSACNHACGDPVGD